MRTVCHGHYPRTQVIHITFRVGVVITGITSTGCYVNTGADRRQEVAIIISPGAVTT